MMAPLVQVEDISKTYSGVRALDAVTFEVQAGEWIAIMGPSGSGKTTLINILGGLDKPTSGRAIVDGVNLGNLGERELTRYRAEKIGFVFQGFNLLSRTSALENVELPMMYVRKHSRTGEHHERAMRALEIVGLGGRAGHHPNQLSGGQQQRVAIARALVNQPAMLLADEPTGNLDTQTSIEIMGVFQKLNDAGITIVMVTHELDIASYTKRNVVMRDGKIVGDTAVANRLVATEELRKLRDAHEAVNLVP